MMKAINYVTERTRQAIEPSKGVAMTEVTVSKRYRINISRGMTGKYSWECTVDIEGGTMDEVLAASDALVKELDTRYPPVEGK